MPVDKAKLSAMLLRIADLWRQNADGLCDIDSRFGDGDHGVTITKIANLITDMTRAWDGEGIGQFIGRLGAAITEIGGGSAGPLYGTLVTGLAEPLVDEKSLDGPTLKRMLAAALEEMRCLTTAKVGDKTMMDAIIPAVEAGLAATDDPAAVLAAAADAAAAGATATEGFVAKFGRAKSYGDKTLGTPDAGAVSTALFFRGLREGYDDDV